MFSALDPDRLDPDTNLPIFAKPATRLASWMRHPLEFLLPRMVETFKMDPMTCARLACVSRAYRTAFTPLLAPSLPLGFRLPNPMPSLPLGFGLPNDRPMLSVMSPSRLHAAVAFRSGKVAVIHLGSGVVGHVWNDFAQELKYSYDDDDDDKALIIMRFSRDGAMLVVGTKLSPYTVFNVFSGARVCSFNACSQKLAIDISTDVIAVNSIGDIELWSLEGTKLRNLRIPVYVNRSHDDYVYDPIVAAPDPDHMRFSHRGDKLAASRSSFEWHGYDESCGDGARLWVYEVETGTQLCCEAVNGTKVLDVAWSRSDTRIVVNSDVAITVFSPRGIELLHVNCLGTSCSWSANGRILAVATPWIDFSKTHVHLIDSVSGRLINTVEHDGNVSNASIYSIDQRGVTLVLFPEPAYVRRRGRGRVGGRRIIGRGIAPSAPVAPVAPSAPIAYAVYVGL